MIKVLIGDDGLTLMSKKVIEKDVIIKLNDKDFAKKYNCRIKGWLKDFNADVDVEQNDGTSEFWRSYAEEDINSIGIECAITNLQHDHMKFLDFIESLIKEDSENPIEEAMDEQKLYIHMEATPNGLTIEGTMSPFMALAGIMAMLNDSKDEEDNKNNQPHNQ